MKKFENALIYVEGQGLVRTSVTFDTRIVSVGEKADGAPIPVPENAIVVPGFIDRHIHGAGGADTMDGSRSALTTFADTLAREGTTRFLATTVTQSVPNLMQALHAVRDYCDLDRKEGAAVLGVHLEGPFISSLHAGAQPPEYIIAPDIALFDKLNAACGNAIRAITLAPESEGGAAFIRHAVQQNVAVSIGHSDATYEQVAAAVEDGATCVTHCYNAQRGLHHREAGVVGAAMLLDGLYTELIADTVHVSVPAMRLLYKNKPHGKLVLVTDALRAKGVGDGEIDLGGQTVTVHGVEARLQNGTLAGSILPMNIAVRNFVTEVGASFCDAVDCATINAACSIGAESDYGSIAPRKVADFTVLAPDFTVLTTVRDGNIVYSI